MNTPPGIVWRDSWELAPVQPQARPDEVHVWRAVLMKTAPEVESFYELLAADERRRADNFHFQRDRAHFIVARGILRKILGLYVRRPPESLRFSYTPFGKPELHVAGDFETPRFNLTHAGAVALYAVTRGREIGIDVEYVRADMECEEIAGHLFSPREVETLRALPPHLRSRAFFNCWTRKEAYIKARGEGLSLPLDEFDVSLSPDEPASLLNARDPQEVARWSLRELTLAPEYVAALAVEGRDWRLRCWDYIAER
ncbi:MAG TPA: 4'-phosphopantetheinyl transferase superfamily protein [Pyrinomonadaceae bacterium]|jgi:4'-phosphopantetheinyl transferase|nr:4'-phosphopantetheinyl transferase superfamily protein [Pyrinomonadaceae bacterium]